MIFLFVDFHCVLLNVISSLQTRSPQSLSWDLTFLYFISYPQRPPPPPPLIQPSTIRTIFCFMIPVEIPVKIGPYNPFPSPYFRSLSSLVFQAKLLFFCVGQSLQESLQFSSPMWIMTSHGLLQSGYNIFFFMRINKTCLAKGLQFYLRCAALLAKI